jgi:hypothetical protein
MAQAFNYTLPNTATVHASKKPANSCGVVDEVSE